MGNLLESLSPLAAIAGGLAQGQLQAQQAAQQQERQRLLDAMRLQQSKSALETGQLQRQMMGMEIEGYESPSRRRQREYMDFLRRNDVQQGDWREQQEFLQQQGREDTMWDRDLQAQDTASYTKQLQGAFPTTTNVTRNYAGFTPPPMQMPQAGLLDIAGPPKGMEALRQSMGQQITPEAIPARQEQRTITTPPENPLFAALSEAGVPYGVQMGPGGTAVPTISEMPTEAQKKMQGLALQEAELGVEGQEIEVEGARMALDQAQRLQPLMEQQEWLKNEGMDLANELRAVQIAGEELDQAITQQYGVPEAMAKLEAARADLRRKTLQTGAIEAMMQSENAQMRDLGYKLAAGVNVSDVGTNSLAATQDRTATQRYVAEGNWQQDELDRALKGAELELRYQKFLTEQGGAQATGASSQQEAAATRGMRLLEDYYEKAIKSETPPPLEGIMPELERHMREAGPLGQDVTAATWTLVDRLQKQGVDPATLAVDLSRLGPAPNQDILDAVTMDVLSRVAPGMAFGMSLARERGESPFAWTPTGSSRQRPQGQDAAAGRRPRQAPPGL